MSKTVKWYGKFKIFGERSDRDKIIKVKVDLPMGTAIDTAAKAVINKIGDVEEVLEFNDIIVVKGGVKLTPNIDTGMVVGGIHRSRVEAERLYQHALKDVEDFDEDDDW